MKFLKLNEGTSSRVLLPCAIICFLLVAAAVFLHSRAEPKYRGKTLLQWAAQLEEPTPALEREAINAFRKLYPRPVTSVAEWVNYDPAPRRSRILRNTRWVPGLVRDAIASAALRDRREERIYAAAVILRALGPEAAAAVPRLEAYANSTNRFIAGNAVSVLGLMGPNGLTGLSNIIERPNHPLRTFAISRFYEPGRLGSDARTIIPLMVRVAREEDPQVAAAGVHALAQIHLEPERSLPILTEALQHPDQNVRTWAIRGLAAFGPSAKKSAPLLLPLLRDPEASTRWDASNALWHMSPELLTNQPATGNQPGN